MIQINLQKKLSSAEGEMHLKVDFSIKEGSFVTLYGKSGAGKTTILRIIAGLIQPDKGHIEVDGLAWMDTDQKINLIPQKRQVGIVFQDYALFPNMSVMENLKFGLLTSQDSSIVAELLEIMELGELKNRKPANLSGGQKQRVALARALVQRPKVLLLDEPLSALDPEMRQRLQGYILQAHNTYGLTTILVSHDTSEIMKLSDHMILLEHGRIIHQGTPTEIFSHKEFSGKFQFFGEIITLVKQDFIYVITILIGNELVKIVVDESEAEDLRKGDKVVVAAKAFNPMIKKIDKFK